MPGYEDEEAEERRRLDEARRRGGIPPLGKPMAPAQPALAAAPVAGIKFGKPFSPLEQQKQSQALQMMLRKRAQEDAAEAEKKRLEEGSE